MYTYSKEILYIIYCLIPLVINGLIGFYVNILFNANLAYLRRKSGMKAYNLYLENEISTKRVLIFAFALLVLVMIIVISYFVRWDQYLTLKIFRKLYLGGFNFAIIGFFLQDIGCGSKLKLRDKIKIGIYNLKHKKGEMSKEYKKFIVPLVIMNIFAIFLTQMTTVR